MPDFIADELMAEVCDEEGGKACALAQKASSLRVERLGGHESGIGEIPSCGSAWSTISFARRRGSSSRTPFCRRTAPAEGAGTLGHCSAYPQTRDGWRWSNNFLAKHVDLNCDDMCDLSHNVWNDCRLALEHSNLWTHIGLMLVTANVPHGPWSEDVRYSEIVGNIHAFFESYSGPHTSPLFESLIQRMIFNLQDSGIMSSPDPAQEVFEHMRLFDPFATKGCKTNMNRFMSILKSAETLVEQWAFRYFAYLLTCLEQDYIKNASIPKLRPKPDDNAPRTTCSSRASTFEAEVSRSCQNQLVVGTLMLAEEANEIRHRFILVVLRSLLRWFEHQSHFLRSVDNSKRWLIDQVRSDFMSCLSQVLNCLQDEDTLRWIGFRDPVDIKLGGQKEVNLVEIEGQDWLASNMAELCVNAVACRLQRSMFLLRGWSSRSAYWLEAPPPQSCRPSWLDSRRSERTTTASSTPPPAPSDCSPSSCSFAWGMCSNWTRHWQRPTTSTSAATSFASWS